MSNIIFGGQVFAVTAIIVAVIHSFGFKLLQIGGMDVSPLIPVAAVLVYVIAPILGRGKSETDYNYAVPSDEKANNSQEKETSDDDDDIIPITGNCPSMEYQQRVEQTSMVTAATQQPVATPAFAVATNADLHQSVEDVWGSDDVPVAPDKDHEVPSEDGVVWGDSNSAVPNTPSAEPTTPSVETPQPNVSGDNSAWGDDNVLWEPPAKEYPTVDE